MKTARKFICVLLAALLSALLLSSCGASGYVGTWHCEAGDADFQMELEKDGQVFFYQTLNDFVYTGTWDETEEGVSVSLDYTDIEMELTANGKDELQNRNWSTPPFIRTKGMEVPRTTVETLSCFYWIDSKTNMELSVYDDGSWELCDDDYNTLNEGSEDSVKINGYDIVLTSDYGGELEMELSEDGSQITGYEDMTFRCITTVGDDEDDGGDAVENVGVDPAEFYGCWEYEAYDLWLVVYENEAYDWISTTDSYSGTYAVEEGELVLDNGMRYTPDGAGGLTDQDGDALFASELSDSGSDGDESVDEDIFQSFVGYWGYDDYDVWAYIYDDGTCEWYSSNGTSISGSCWMEGEVLRMELEDDTVMEFSLQGDGLVDHEGDTLSWSTVPDNLGENDWDDEEDDWYYEEPAAGGEGFVGCWEAATADVWLCIYDDGTFEWYEGGSLGRSSTYEIYGDEICLDMGADMWLTLDDDGWLCHETEDLEMFPSQLPDYLR